MSPTHYQITPAALTALATVVIGQLVAFVPAFSADKQMLVSIASTTISAAFLIANAIHAHANAHAPAAPAPVAAVSPVTAPVAAVPPAA